MNTLVRSLSGHSVVKTDTEDRFKALPDELKLMIIGHLDAKVDVMRLSQTSKDNERVCRDVLNWKRLYVNHPWHMAAPNKPETADFRERFKHQHAHDKKALKAVQAQLDRIHERPRVIGMGRGMIYIPPSPPPTPAQALFRAKRRDDILRYQASIVAVTGKPIKV